MAKGRVVFYEDPPPRTQTPARPVYTARARRRRRRRHRLRGLLFALAMLVLASAVGYVLWYTHPAHQSTIEDPDRAQVETDAGSGGSADLAAVPEAKTSDGRIVVAIDPGHGGVYWSLNADGSPLDTKKQIYALGFAIYGLSEYARATADPEALDYAVRLFRTIEQHSFDRERNGYVEAFTRDWQPIADMRLSDKDANTSKTMNTHLHILEPYTNLFRVWPDAQLEAQLRNLVALFTTRILDPATHHLGLFFDDGWHVQGDAISYGHDIEASWLLHEAALVLDDPELLRQVGPTVVRIAQAADEGLNPDGSMVYERFPGRGHTDRELHWWVQAESVVGHANLYQHFADEAALDVAARCWQFIRSKLIDREHGEWHWSILPDGTVNRRDDKAGFWKCPYHNGRMCMELIERFGEEA